MFDGTGAGWLLGIQLIAAAVAAVMLAPLMARSVTVGSARPWLLGLALAAGSVALGATKFPSAAPAAWGRTSFETFVWMLHLFGGAIWIGGLAGLLLLCAPGLVADAQRGAFWSALIRRFSAVAMSCVAAIGLSGLFLYWEHVDGPAQLWQTMYGRVLGVKIVLFDALLLLGIVNQFLLHPRIEALRAEGDDRPLRTVLARQFPVIVGLELMLGLTVLFVAPFLHGSARNQAFRHAAAPITPDGTPLPRIAPKMVSASTWGLGIAETVAVIAVMVVAYLLSGRIARSRMRAAEQAA